MQHLPPNASSYITSKEKVGNIFLRPLAKTIGGIIIDSIINGLVLSLEFSFYREPKDQGMSQNEILDPTILYQGLQGFLI